jgi:PhnB protein
MAKNKKMAKGKMAARKPAPKKKLASKIKMKLKPKAQPIPKGFHAVTPSLTVRGASQAIEFYKTALGAKERSRMPGPDGKVMHSELQIGDSMVIVIDEMPEMGARGPQSLGGSSSSLMIYCKDADALFARATSSGAKVKMPMADMFWGDRYGQVEDPFGHSWQIATRKEDLKPKEMMKRMAAEFGPGAKGAPAGSGSTGLPPNAAYASGNGSGSGSQATGGSTLS